MTIAQQLEQKGKQLGAREAILKIAQTMLENGMDWAFIMKMTGLTEQDRQYLKH